MAPPPSKARPRWKKWLLRIGAGAAVAVGILILALLCLPLLVSSSWMNDRVEELVSQSMKRPVSIQSLAWDWSGGLQMQELSIADDASGSDEPILSLARLTFRPLWDQLLQRRLAVDIDALGLHLSFVRQQGGETNWDFLRPQTGAGQEGRERAKAPETGRIKVPLPVDVGCRVRLRDLALRARDLTSGHSLDLKTPSFTVQAPSLHHQPVSVRARARGTLDGNPLPPLGLDLTLAGLLDKEGAVDTQNLSVDFQARLPGCRVDVSGDLGQTGVSGRVDLDLAELQQAVSPLLPSPAPHVGGSIAILSRLVFLSKDSVIAELEVNGRGLSLEGAGVPEVSGDVSLSIEAEGDPGGEASYTLTVQGKDLRSVSAGRPVGPLELRVHQQGRTDLKQWIEVTSGQVWLGSRSSLHWEGRISGLQGLEPDMELWLSQGRLDCREVLALVRPFIPGEIDIRSDRSCPDLLRIKRLYLRAQPWDRAFRLDLDRLDLATPALVAKSKAGLVDIGPVTVVLDEAVLSVSSTAELVVKARGRCLAEGLRILGEPEASVDVLNLPRLALASEDLVLSENSPWGVSGSITLGAGGEVKAVDLPGSVSVKDLDLSLGLDAKFTEQGRLILGLDAGRISSPEVRILRRPGQTVTMPLEVQVDTGRVTVALDRPEGSDIEDVRLGLGLGRALDLDLKASVFSLGRSSLEAGGEIRIDTGEMTSLLAGLLPGEVVQNGTVKTEFSFSGRVPAPRELSALMDGTTPLSARLRNVDFLGRLDLQVGCSGLNTRWGVPGAGLLEVRGLSCDPGLALSMDNGLQRTVIRGGLEIEDIRSLPGLDLPVTPLGLSLSVRAEQTGLDTISMEQQLRLRPLAVTQKSELTLANWAQLLDRDLPGVLPAALATLQSRFSGGLKVDFGPSFQRLTPELAARGSVEAGFKTELAGGKRVDVSLELKSPGLDAKIGDFLDINQLRSDLKLSKTYSIRRADQGASPEVFRLSDRVLAPPGTERDTGMGFGGGVGTRSGWIQKFSAHPDLSLARAVVSIPALPVQVTDLAVDIGQNQGIPGVDAFQLDLWSGTVIGKARILPRDKGFGLDLACSFSGLNAVDALPPRLRTTGDTDSELSGRFLLWQPLSDRVEDMLRSLELTLDLTHIGSRTLQRFLYALDPTGSNEAVVRQRNLLRNGRPKRIRVRVEQGNLFVTGEAEVKGVDLELPPIKRFRIAALPLGTRLADLNLEVDKVLDVLHAGSASSIDVQPDGSLLWNRTTP